MSVGEILGGSWNLYTKFFVRFFVVAIIVFAVVELIYALALTAARHGGALAGLLSLVAVVVGFVGTCLLQGALVFAVQDVRDGKIDTTVGELFEKVRPYIGTLVGGSLLAGLGIFVGFILLIVPGLILLTWWCLLVPSIVLEGKGATEALGRSRELVKGHAWTVFGVVIITSILSGIAAAILGAVFSFLGTFLGHWIGGAISQAVIGPFFAVALTLMYFKLHDLKEPSAAAPPAPAAPADAPAQ